MLAKRQRKSTNKYANRSRGPLNIRFPRIEKAKPQINRWALKKSGILKKSINIIRYKYNYMRLNFNNYYNSLKIHTTIAKPTKKRMKKKNYYTNISKKKEFKYSTQPYSFRYHINIESLT